MKTLLYLLFILLLLACNNTPTTTAPTLSQHQQDSLDQLNALLEKEARQEQVEDSLVQAFEVKLTRFLGILPPQTDSLNLGDTLITLDHDFSFAGLIGSKYTQILKTNDQIQLTEVIYSNRDEGQPSIKWEHPLIADFSCLLYGSYFQQITCSIEDWNALVALIQQEQFYKMGKEDCGRIVLDGTTLALTIRTTSRSHRVSRHNCPEQGLYLIGQQIEALSPNPLEFY